MSDNNAKEQAIAQANSIAAMVAALNVDYDRLEELNDELESLKDDAEFDEDKDGTQEHRDALAARDAWPTSEEGEELTQLLIDAGDCKDYDQASERIQEDVLDVQVRSDWYSPGNGNYGDSDSVKPSEFMILLCTGGPAVRIMGELDEHMQPCRAWIEYQDWGTAWTMLDSTHYSQSTLLEYCQQFYFGE